MPGQNTPPEGAAGLVFDIQRFSVHDGPGIRTTVFLKGCPLRCDWCANPESQAGRIELLYWSGRCDCCGICLENVCPAHALSVSEDPAGKIRLDRTVCTLCGDCVPVCPQGALQLSGRRMSAREVVEEVLKDAVFYRRSGGGMTLGGGEPLFQCEFAVELLREAKSSGVNTAVDTCGYAPWSDFQAALPYTDLILFDLKHINSEMHRRLTGVDCDQILQNLVRVRREAVALIVRVPIIPGLNDSVGDIDAIGTFVAALEPRPPIELIPYHRLGVSKYKAIGRECGLETRQPPTEAEIKRLRAAVAAMDLEVL